MEVKDLLRRLSLGNSVAEHDDALERYFVETEAFRQLAADECDIIGGDKGTGKTALYRILEKRYASMPELAGVEVIPAFNPVGNPVFQRLAEGDVLEEGQYASIWKAYFLALVGNWVLSFYEDGLTESMQELDELLRRLDLRSDDDSPSTIFSALVNLVRRLANPTSAEAAITLTAQGMPVIVPRVEFGSPPASVDEEARIIPHEEAYDLLEEVLRQEDLTFWVAMDRLDEAFQGFPKAEVPALRALLRTYLDLQPYRRIRLKLFLRRDLFRRVTSGTFVNLTHVNARRIDIEWDDEDLFEMVFRRILENPDFLAALGTAREAKPVFDAIFPAQVDPGSRRPTTWSWILSRIRDGNGIKPPRNLIDLVKKSQEAQLRQENRLAREFEPGEALIQPEALKRGLAALSKERVEDTLLAEAGEHAALIERFRSGKSEHTSESLRQVLGLSEDATKEAIKVLRELGFLEAAGESLKVPMLYRDGLGMRQGKGFDADADAEIEDEE